MAGRLDPEQLRQIGRFPVVRFIASGGQAWVFEVEDPQKYNDRYALKLLKPDAAAGTDLVRFEDETRFQMTIKHPNLLRVYERGTDEATGLLFYVMDLMTLGTLAEVRIADPELTVTSSALVADETMVCKYVSGALAGLAHIHAEGLIHRDIKPQNIFIDHGDVAKLGDLGVAKRRGQAGVTERGYAPGTVLYMSPEQMTGDELGPQSDIFAAGLVLYRVLTGRTIYEEVKELDSTNSNAVLRHLWELQRTGSDFVFEFPGRVPQPIQEVARKACSIYPEDRYQTAGEMRQALDHAVLVVEAARTTGSQPIMLRERSWATTLALAGVAVLAFAGGGWFGWNWYQQRVVEGETRQHLRRVTEVGLQVEELTGVVMADGAPQGLVDDARALKEDGDASLFDAQRFIDAGSPRFALLKLEDAENIYATACGQLAKGHLQGSADRASRTALAALGAVHPSAQEYQAERWKELQGWKEKFAAPDQAASGCTGAQALIARADDAGRAQSAAAGIKAAMGDQLPKIAASEIDNAVRAGDAARAAGATFAPYQAALGEGDRALDRARKQLGRAGGSSRPEDFEASMASSGEASTAYQSAAEAAAAFEKRGETRQLVANARDAGISIGLNRSRLEAAGAAFGAASWSEAREGYAGVAQDVGTLLDDSKPARAALRDARSARADAIRSGVSADNLRVGDELLQSGMARIQPGKLGEAESTLGRATQFYAAKREEHAGAIADTERARSDARAAIATASDARTKARETGGSGPIYVAALSQGEDALKGARALSRGRKYAGVPALAGQASDAFSEAARIVPAQRTRQTAEREAAAALDAGLGEPLWDVDANTAHDSFETRNWETASRAYERMARRIRELLAQSKPAAEARARAAQARTRKPIPEGDEALLDGDAERELGDHALRRGDFDAAVGYFDGAVKQYARYRVNHPPELALSPGGKKRSIEVGQKLDFRAKVSDLDGDPIEVRFDLDGKTVQTGTHYTFKPSEPGEYVVKVIATDGKAQRSQRRTIVVKPKPAVVAKRKPKPAVVAKRKPKPAVVAKRKPKPAVVAKRKPKPAVVPKPKPTVKAVDQPPPLQDVVVKFLEDYRRAFERKDMSALRTMRVMDDDEVGDIENVFGDCADDAVEPGSRLKVDLSYDKTSIRVTPARMKGERMAAGKKVKLEFTQTTRGCEFIEGWERRYTASLWQRLAGDWRMRLTPAR